MIRVPINSQRRCRPGSALLLVLVTLALLTYSTYVFVDAMVSELEAVRAASTQLQLESLARSGIESLAGHLEKSTIADRSTIHLTELWSGEIALDPSGQIGTYELWQSLKAEPTEDLQQGWRNESSKLNLNALPLADHQRSASRTRLMALPRMTKEIADAILDWMDEDDDTSEFGAESAYYQSLSPPYAPRQGRLTSLAELLMVRGVTSELLYGNPGNIADPGGWSSLITLNSRESNRRPNGLPKIHLNSPDLLTLYSTLEQELGEKAAKFIVAWRLAGSLTGAEGERIPNSEMSAEERANQRRTRRFQTARERLNKQLGRDPEDTPSDSAREFVDESRVVMRGGIDIGRKPAYHFRSIFDLFGTKVRIDVDRKDTILESPWSDNFFEMRQSYPTLNELLTTSHEEFEEGRINILRASSEVLMTIPGMTDTIARRIVAFQETVSPNRDPFTGMVSLLQDGGLDLKQARLWGPYITDGGDVVSGHCIAKIRGETQIWACAFLIDASMPRARVLNVSEYPANSIDPRLLHNLQWK